MNTRDSRRTSTEGEHVFRGRVDEGAAFMAARSHGPSFRIFHISRATEACPTYAGLPRPTRFGRGIFGTHLAEFRKSGTSGFSSVKKRAGFQAVSLRKVMAQVLPLCITSSNVFRAALLSLVLTLALGQNVALLCGTWCHSGAGMVGACEHQTQATTPSVVANDDCAVNANPVVFVREDGRRSASAPDVARAVAVAGFAFTPPAAGTLSGYEPNGRLLLELRPLVLALRI